MEIKDHTIEILSDREESMPSQASLASHDQHTSLTTACSYTSTSIDTTTNTVLQPSNFYMNKHNNPSHDRQANACKNIIAIASQLCLIARLIFIMLLTFILFLIYLSLAMVFTSIIIPVIIICLVLGYWVTCLHQFVICDDYADVDDAYDTDLGTYWYHLVFWMARLTGILLVELLVFLAIFGIGPFPLRKLSLIHLRVWKWLLISIIFLVYFILWCLMRILLHQAREKLCKSVSFRVHVLPICEALLGVAIWGFYFLAEWFVFKLVPLLEQPKFLGLYAHRWVHALVYVFIGVYVCQFLSASVVALLHKHHENNGQFDSRPSKDDKSLSEIGMEDIQHPNKILYVMRTICRFIMKLLFRKICRFIMKLLFRKFDIRKCIVYVVVGLRRSIFFVFVSIWLLVTWTSYFMHQLKPSKDVVWVLLVGTATLTCLPICAVLWLVKNSIMLWWKYHSIYSRFHREIIETGTTLYFLGMICGQHLDVLRVEWSGNKKKETNEEENKKAEKEQEKEEEKVEEKKKKKNEQKEDKEAEKKEEVVKKKHDETRTQNRIQRVVAKARLMLVYDPNKADHLGIYAIMQMVKYFLLAEDVFQDNTNAIKKFLKTWHQTHDQISHSKQLSEDHIKPAYKKKFSDEDIKIIHSKIKGKGSLCLKDFEIWMESSYKDCFSMVTKLASAQRLANYLDRVMIAVITFSMFGIWLCMVTRSTRFVTLLAAALTALAFMIGDTCSTIFKGIIFAYVIHPFHIGDLCIIKETLYEVKQIDLWRTTFLKVEIDEIEVFPNSALLNESVINKINKKGRLVTHDRVQFSLESDTDEQNIKSLRNKIDDIFKDNSELLKPKTEVEYDIAKPIKVTIQFKHNLKSSWGKSNLEHVQEMKRHKQNLLLRIVKLHKELKIKVV